MTARGDRLAGAIQRVLAELQRTGLQAKGAKESPLKKLRATATYMVTVALLLSRNCPAPAQRHRPVFALPAIRVKERLVLA